MNTFININIMFCCKPINDYHQKLLPDNHSRYICDVSSVVIVIELLSIEKSTKTMQT